MPKLKKQFESIKTEEKCRCCTAPSVDFVNLDNCFDLNEGKKKTYKDLLYEITNFRLNMTSENKLPQQICRNCEIQLKDSYKFIQQVHNVYQQYIKLLNLECSSDEDQKNFDHLQETLIEISETSFTDDWQIEPFNIDPHVKIENYHHKPTALISNKENSQENEVFTRHLNEDELTSDGGDSNDPEANKDFDLDLNNKSVARSCDICHKIYKNEQFLNIHKRYTHMPEENKHPCPLCKYKASRTSAIKVHMSSIHGPDKLNEYFKPVLDDTTKKFKCKLCSRSYELRGSLSKHMRRKHLNNKTSSKISKNSETSKPKEKQFFLCNHCGQSYNSKSGLESHSLTHSGERPFSCEVCHKTFKRLNGLQFHRVVHSDEKPYKCSQCNKSFKRSDKLKVHMRVHSELRPYKCNECGKSFKYPNVLRTHMHIHTGQTPFSCKTCGEAFSLRTSLNNHCLKNGHQK